MNAIAHKSLIATALVGLLGAASLAFVPVEFDSYSAQPEVLKFERVVVVGKRAAADPAAAIVQLPRVVIEGRAGNRATQVAAAKAACPATALC